MQHKMNINRLLSRREKDGNPHRRQRSRDKSADQKTRPLSSGEETVSVFKSDPHKRLSHEQDVKIQKIQERLHRIGYTNISDERITYALQSKHAYGDVDRALELIVLFQESENGVIKPYNPATHMRGAENREGVTCFLDALLFAMFARLESFEPILYTKFEDEPRNRLATLIRLWVNMLRTGKLIQTDITGHLQEALARCGWEEAASLKQQDTSEAFSFITEQLELPLLTLKMDIYHTGKEDDTDDHKFIHERLLEVAVPPDSGHGRPIQLEDCLESFFNNRVEVVRRLERTNTISSNHSLAQDKGGSQHVETSEVTEPRTPLTPTDSRNRSASIIRHRLVLEEENGEPATESDAASINTSVHKGSIRKEVLMPAWQFFNLIPWYTKGSPTSDAEVAAHFSKTRPVLGICLKRYTMTVDGRATRQNTFIDIPLDIRLPHFIEDDMMSDTGPLIGNFKLSLQSVICHRGNSLHSGHYVSFVRGAAEIADGDSTSSRRLSSNSRPPNYPADRWIRHDDLAQPDRVQYVDIEQALKDEMPYLLFYQIQPTSNIPLSSAADHRPPLYDSGIDLRVSECSPVVSNGQPDSYCLDNSTSESTPGLRDSSEIERPRYSINLPEERRGSLALTDTSIGSIPGGFRTPEVVSMPPTPPEETTAQRITRAASRFTRSSSKSRPASSSGEKRPSATFPRMSMWGKDAFSKAEHRRDAAKDLVASPPMITAGDGATEPHEVVITVVEEPTSQPRESARGLTRNRLGIKRDKSKDLVEKRVNGSNHYLQKGKGKDVPDRECRIM